MVAFGAMELVFLMAFNAGGVPTDLVSFLKAEDYFQARNIEVNAGEMLRLAGTEPKDAKTSLQQLLALRWLADHPTDLKKATEARKLLETLAAGKKGDAQGFAREYATAALAVLDGKAPPVRTMPENSIKVDALSWFPEKSAIFGGTDFRPADAKLTGDDSLRGLAQRAIMLSNARARAEIYGIAESLGNVRVDRVSMAFEPDAKGSGKIYIRVTGLADRGRLAGLIQQQNKNATAKEEKGPKGEPITLLEQGGREPALALIGDTDLIVAGHAHGSDGNNLEVVKEVLAVRAAGKGSVTAGPQADLLKEAPATATALVIGRLPLPRKDIQNAMGVEFASLIPDRFRVQKTTSKSTDVGWYGTFDKAEDAKAFVAQVAKLKDQGIMGLKAIPENLKIKKETVALLIKTLEGVKAEADGKTVSGGVQIAPEVTRAVTEVLELFMRGRSAPDLDAPAPPKKM
jgi:hypothetical protein